MSDIESAPRWTSWGNDYDNSRFQPAAQAGLAAADVPKLKLKWALGLPETAHAWSQPTVAGGRVFVGSQGGRVFSLDAKSGCVIWTFQTQGATRTAVTIGPGQGAHRYLAYFTSIPGWLYAVDADTGAQVWRIRMEEHLSARLTGSPVIHRGRLYIGAGSFEEGLSAGGKYECCSFRGSLRAFDALTGALVWRSPMIQAPMRTLKEADGRRVVGPSGGSIWSAPVIDEKRGVLYVTTGNGFSGPPEPLTDAVVALDLGTGKVRWSRQFGEEDIYVPGCNRPGNTNFACPADNGPDADFGSAPILGHLANGRDVLVAAQKSGAVWALDPDRRGAIVWHYQAAPKAAGDFGAIVWGQARDARNVYVPVSNIEDPPHAGGLHALSLATGKPAWVAPAAPVACSGEGCTAAQASAPSAIDGVVFAGSADGVLRAYSTRDGKVIWSADTNGEFSTVNGVKAHGGSIIAAGPAIAGGMLYVNSGYGSHRGRAGNVLLAYGLD